MCIIILYRKVQTEEVEKLRHCRLGAIFGQVMYGQDANRYSLLPKIYSLNLWRQGISESSLLFLNKLGVTVQKKTNRKSVDNVTEDYQKFKRKWVEDIGEVKNQII